MIYPISEEQEIFYFETETQNRISVEFNDLTQLFEANFPIYCVDIFRLENSNNHVNETNGHATRDTIVFIIQKFLDKFDSALVAFIDTTTDNKGKARFRLFQSWFRKFGNDEFSITPREITFSEAESYSLLIIRKNFVNANLLIDAFDKFLKLANSPDT